MFSHIERSIREKIAQEIESAVIEVAGNSAHTMRQAAAIARGKNEYRDSILKEANQQIRD